MKRANLRAGRVAALRRTARRISVPWVQAKDTHHGRASRSRPAGHREWTGLAWVPYALALAALWIGVPAVQAAVPPQAARWHCHADDTYTPAWTPEADAACGGLHSHGTEAAAPALPVQAARAETRSPSAMAPMAPSEPMPAASLAALALAGLGSVVLSRWRLGRR